VPAQSLNRNAIKFINYKLGHAHNFTATLGTLGTVGTLDHTWFVAHMLIAMDMFLLPPNGANTAEQNSTAQPNTHRAHSRVNFIAELRLKGNINMEIMNMLGQ